MLWAGHGANNGQEDASKLPESLDDEKAQQHISQSPAW